MVFLARNKKICGESKREVGDGIGSRRTGLVLT